MEGREGENFEIEIVYESHGEKTLSARRKEQFYCRIGSIPDGSK